ncbi:MAG TPA: isoprenylcysteine carboxylmethyltransferase family protein [Ignavibacteria bacterium]|nr:isoprenylcysteine carboxylmethyltransferase family protein [Ignavibacteria bacterium]
MSQFAKKIFTYRSYTPIPFLIVMLIYQEATLESLIIGFVVSLTGEAFRLWGVSVAGSETRTTGAVGGTFLVVTGAFAYVRNPLYLGNILLYLGIGIMSMALFPYLQVVALAFFYFQYRIIIAQEEEYLVKTFGSQYEDYKKNVPRLIPRLTPYKNPGVEQPEYNIKKGLKSETRSLQAFVFVTGILVVLFLMDVN